MTRFLTSLLAITAATPALAQGNPTQPTTDADGSTIVVTASRSGDATPVELLGASVTVIDAEAMEQRQTRLVSDVLRDVPGVAVSRSGAVGGMTQIRLRGSESNHALVLIDGIKASDPFYGEFDFAGLIADEEAKIEVLRGQQSALYGSDAIGGVVNYITLTGAEAPGIRLRAEGGSMGTFTGGARAAGVSGPLDYAVSAGYYHTDGYPVAIGGSRDVGSDVANASAKLIWTAAPNLHVTGVVRYSYVNADVSDTDNDFSSPTFGFIVDSPGVHYRNEALYGLVRAQLDLLDGRWTNALTGQVADARRTGFDVVDPFSPIAGQPIIKSYGDHGRRLKGSYESAFRFGTDALKHRVTVALDMEKESERTTVSQFGAFLGWRHTSNVGLVGQYDLTFDDRLAIGASIRRDFNDRFADATTYRVQGSYLFPEGTRIHGAAGSGVKAPSFSELFDFIAGRYTGNPDLKPERSTGWEIGIEQAFLGRAVLIGATFFDDRLKDQITTDFSTGVARPINLPGKDKQQGVELTLAARVGGWRFDGSYTFLHAPQEQNVLPVTNFVPTVFDGQAVRRARNIASANLSWAPPELPFSATLTVRYNGRQNDLAFIDPSFTPKLVRLRSYTLVNLGGTYQVTRNIELFARVENLLDRNYVELFSYATPGRAAYGGVRVKL